ncbi:uncharacterized protein VTP21DRAFT_6900 [Calcarisporiella thermophila]|uniref:uncharacterized protein n=1 Tax=Calcarisporiella thermophila TaxID=911321 RepID=UPI00374489ED
MKFILLSLVCVVAASVIRPQSKSVPSPDDKYRITPSGSGSADDTLTVDSTGNSLNKRINYGEPISDAWIVKILHSENKAMTCTASMINERFALTAAHCSDAPERLLVSSANGTIYTVMRTIDHPEYTVFSSDNLHDIALLRINGTYESEVFPSLATREYQKGTPLIVAGFGASKIPGYNENRKYALSTENSIAFYNRDGKVILNEKEVVVSGQSVLSGFRKGDSGGPSFLRENGKPVLIGVHSQHDSDISVAKYRSWIEENIARE